MGGSVFENLLLGLGVDLGPIPEQPVQPTRYPILQGGAGHKKTIPEAERDRRKATRKRANDSRKRNQQ